MHRVTYAHFLCKLLGKSACWLLDDVLVSSGCSSVFQHPALNGTLLTGAGASTKHSKEHPSFILHKGRLLLIPGRDQNKDETQSNNATPKPPKTRPLNLQPDMICGSERMRAHSTMDSNYLVSSGSTSCIHYPGIQRSCSYCNGNVLAFLIVPLSAPAENALHSWSGFTVPHVFISTACVRISSD